MYYIGRHDNYMEAGFDGLAQPRVCYVDTLPSGRTFYFDKVLSPFVVFYRSLKVGEER
jgi:hypothetical protein